MHQDDLAEIEQSLCVSCGLCCKGVTLSGVRLAETELPKAARLHLTVVDTPRGSAFALPCPNLSSNRCQVYDDRPSACASYRCKLLDAVATGNLAATEARSRILELLGLVRVIESLVTAAKMPEFLRVAAHAADPETPTELRAQLLQAMGPAKNFWLTLRSLLDDWVHSPAELQKRLESRE